MGIDFKRTFAGIGLTIVGFATGNPYLAIAGLGLLQQGINAIDRPPRQRREGVLSQSVNTENALPIVYGVARVGSKIVFQDTRDTSRGPNTRLDMVAAFCLGNRVPQDISSGIDEGTEDSNGDIEGIGSVFFDEYRAFDETGAPTEFLTTEVLVNFHAFPGGAAAEFYPHLGAHDQAADQYMLDTSALTGDNAWSSGTSWTSAHQGQGVCYGVFALRGPATGEDISSEDRSLQRIFPGGQPQITAMIKGRKVYDPRTAAWAWSDNLALCIRDYLLDDKAGCALLLTDLDEDSFELMADASDEIISDPLSIAAGLAQFRCNGVVDTDRPVIQNLQDLLFTGGLVLSYEQGVFRLKRFDENAAPSDFRLDETNIIGDWSFQTNDPAERVNSMVVKYVNGSEFTAEEIADQTAEVHVPYIGVTNTYLAADGGYEVPKTLDFPFINTESHAYVAGLRELTFARNDLTVTVKAMEAALELSICDVVLLSHRDFSFVDKPFYVVGMGLNPDETVALALRAVDDSGVPAFSGGGGGATPFLEFAEYCTVFDAGGLYPGQNSSALTGVAVYWSAPPAEDATHEDYQIHIRRAACSNFDPFNSSAGSPDPEYDCGYETDLNADANTAQPWNDDYLGVITGGPTSSKVCAESTTLAAGYYRAWFSWTDPTGAGNVVGPLSAVVQGPAPLDLEDA